jgi:hypothetical protein
MHCFIVLMQLKYYFIYVYFDGQKQELIIFTIFTICKHKHSPKRLSLSFWNFFFPFQKYDMWEMIRSAHSLTTICNLYLMYYLFLSVSLSPFSLSLSLSPLPPLSLSITDCSNSPVDWTVWTNYCFFFYFYLNFLYYAFIDLSFVISVRLSNYFSYILGQLLSVHLKKGFDN